MHMRNLFVRYTSLSLLAFTLSNGFAAAPALGQQQGKASGFRRFLNGLNALNAGANAGSIVGQWQGGKTENDPIHGGYLNLDFAFQFSPDGTYREAAYMGGRQVMFATGSYQLSAGNAPDDPSFTDMLSLSPEQCQFASDELTPLVKFFPIPTDQGAQYYVGFSALAGGGQLTLKDAAMGRMGESWGLKPAR